MRVPKLSLPFFVSIVLLTCLSINHVCAQAGTASLSISVTTTDPTCGASNGTILVTATGGTPPYTYSVNGFYQNSGYFDGRGPGTVIMGVKDATNAIQTTTVTLTETKHQPSATAAITNNPSVCNGINGVVTLSPIGGVPPYQYSFDYDANYQTSNVFSNLSFGQYAFYVMDANGCVGYAPIVKLIDNNCPIVIWGWSYGQIMFCNTMGYIRITGVSGGTPPYQYSIDGINYQVSPDFNNLGPAIYNVYVKDATGFTKVLAFQIGTACRVDITYVAVDAACMQNDGALTVTAIKGTPPYTYSIDGINYQSGNIFTGLAAGIYTVTVKDAANKMATRTATVYDRCPVVSLAATGETCLLHDGTVTAAAIKGTPPYQYSIDGVNFQTSNIFTGLDAGDYTITLKDALSFTSVTTVKVENVCLNVSAGATNSTCGNRNGSILISASNGTAPYQYSIDGINFQPVNSFTGLAAGPYTVSVKDATGKTGNATITVNNTAGPQINATGTPALCNNNEGAITISGVGGTTPYQFSLDGTTYQNNGTFNNRDSGAYTAWVKDANGCTASQPVNVDLNCPSLTANFVNETCGSSNASIALSATGGTPPYQFSIDGVNFQNNTIFSSLTAGTYTVSVKDALGAIKTAPVTINNVCPRVSVVVTDGLCGAANASLIATGANGTAPYEYSKDGTNFQFSNSFTGLTNGTYTITVRDANGLTNTTSAVVRNFPGPTISATSNSATCINNDGSINISSTGGTLPLRYSIDGTTFLSSNVFSGLPRDNYVATVKDANGCLATQVVVVSISNNLSFNAGVNPTICEGAATIFNCTSNGSVFNWSPSAGLSNPSILNPSASPGITTTYYVTVSLGVCIKVGSVTVFVNPAPVADAGNGSTICFGQSAQLSGAGGLNYNWTPAAYLSDAAIANPAVVQPSSTISYALIVTDGNGCKSIQPSTVTITVTPPSKVFAGNDTSIVMNQPFTLQAKDVNNSGFTQYGWTPSFGLNNSAAQNPVAVLDRNMTYTVIATTPQGCSGTDEINIKVYQGPDIYVPNAFSPNRDGRNDVLKAIPVGIKEFKYFNVYNRWGQLIFSTKDASRGWSGEISHVPQAAGTFVWMAEGLDGKGNVVRRRGTVVLIR
jgi:gliding motility-associated-like protein